MTREEEKREKDFKRNYGIPAHKALPRVPEKCFVCKGTEGLKTLGISGLWEKEWDYCKEHYMAAKIERDSYLVKKGHQIYDRVPYHEDIVAEYRKRGEVKD